MLFGFEMTSALFNKIKRGDFMESFIAEDKVHEGHRSRMRSKLISHGRRIFDTYELLEMLLYQVIPYKDTNPIAKNLLYAFGGLDGVLSATREELVSVCGIGERTADYLISVGRLSDIIGAEIVAEGGPDFSDYESVGRYLTNLFSGSYDRQVVALFLDSSMRLLSVRKLYDLEYESGGVKAKPFIDEAVRTHASVVITAHNHPYGPFFPTQGDRATNSMITESLNIAGFVHAEHYIISGDFFAGIGSLKNFSVNLSQMPAVADFVDAVERYDGRLHKAAAFTDEEKLLQNCGGQNIIDREYFEKLVGYSSTKNPDAAGILLEKYKTIENVLTAPVRELSNLVGEKAAAYLKLLGDVTSRRKTDEFTFGKKHSTAEIAEYLKAVFLGESVEKTYILTYDPQDRITGCEILGEGTVNGSEILPRKAIEAAISRSASSVSIAHNHPFGTTNPSVDDINITQLFGSLFNSCDITLREHFVIAGQLCDTIII